MDVAGKYFDSLDPILTSDPQSLPTEKVVVEPGAIPKVSIVNADRRLDARIAGHNLLTLLGSLSDDGAFDAILALKVDGNFFTCAFHKGMGTEDFVTEIERRLPPGYQAGTRESSMSDVLIISIARRAPIEPELSFLATDSTQVFRPTGQNRLRIEGVAHGGDAVRTHLELWLEGYRLRLPLAGGDTPLATARRLREALPKRYTALIEVPRDRRGDVTLTILRRG